MKTAQELLRDLEERAGMKRSDVAARVNIDERTLRKVANLPGYVPRDLKSLVRVHREVFPSPFPVELKYLEAQIDHFLALREEKDSSERCAFIERMLPLLDDVETVDLLKRALYEALKGYLNHEKAFRIRGKYTTSQRQQSSNMAAEAFSAAYEALTHRDSPANAKPDYAQFKGRMVINLAATVWNAMKEGFRSTDETREWLIECQFVNHSKSLLATDPSNWRVAYNGLIAASTLEELRDSFFFFRSLVAADERFLDLDWRHPANKHPIRTDPDFTWFVQSFEGKER